MLLEWLERFGYLTSDDVTRIRDGATELLQGAIGLLKHRLDLPDDLPADTLMEAPRCGCPDILPLTAEPVRWRKRDLTYRVQNYLPAAIVPQSVQDDVFAEGTRDWSNHLDITFKRVAMGAKADITIFAKPIDGVGRILAQAQMPNGSDSPLWLQFDSTEQAWSLVQGSREANLFNVFKHELGHNLGHPHNPDRRAIMYAMANSAIVDVTELDIAASVALGYPRRTAPVPPDVPPPPVPVPPSGGFKMRDFVDAVLKLLDWRNQSWAERIASVSNLLDLFAKAFQGQPEPAPTVVAEMTTDQLEAEIRAKLPVLEEGTEQAVDIAWAAVLWPLLRAYLMRVFGTLG